MNLNLTLLGQMIAFAMFVYFCMRFVWPPIISAINAREKKIADGLAAAEKGLQQQEEAQKLVEEELAKAKIKASEIIGKAEKRGSELVETAKGSAKEEGAKIVQNAHAEVEREMNMAKDALKSQVSVLAIQGAEKILSREVDKKSHSKMLEELAAKL